MQPLVKTVSVNYPVYNYLNSLLKMRCFSDLQNIYCKSDKIAKELTESFAALYNLRRVLGSDIFLDKNTICLHIGDGTYPRTATMFSYILRGSKNFSIDPELNINWVNENLSDVEGLYCTKSKIEDFDSTIIEGKNIILVLVHSHVNTELVIKQINEKANVIAVYVNPCCYPKEQLLPNIATKEDWGILSDERQFQVWVKE